MVNTNIILAIDVIEDIKEGVGGTLESIGDKIGKAIEGAVNGLGGALANAFEQAIIGVAKWAALGIIDNSYWICLSVAGIGFVLYLGGWKKGAK